MKVNINNNQWLDRYSVISIVVLLLITTKSAYSEIANNDQSDLNSMIEQHVGEGVADQLNNNINKINSYYKTIKKQLHKEQPKVVTAEKNAETFNNTNETLTKTEKQKNLNTINNKATLATADKLNDKTVYHLMKQAGVTKNDTQDEHKTQIKVYRDPFALTNALTGGGRQLEDSLPFTQQTFNDDMPKMVLKGMVKKPDGTRVALLELDEQVTYMVKEKDRIGLSILGIDSVIHIQEIHENTIIVAPGIIDAGEKKEIIVVR